MVRIAWLLVYTAALGCAGAQAPTSNGATTGESPLPTSDSGSSSTARQTSTTTDPSDPDVGTDNDTDGGSDTDTGQLPPKGVPVIVAQGFMGRTTISCDDGLTWRANRSFDLEGHALVCGNTDSVRCDGAPGAGATSCSYLASDGSCTEMPTCDCGHGTGYGKGVAFGRDQVFANFGWGYPGAVLRSSDGVSWEVALSLDEALYPNILFAQDRFVLYSGFKPYQSTDGERWIVTTAYPGEGGRASAFLDYESGRFIAAQDGDIIRVSADGGLTWPLAPSVPDGCIDGIGQAQKIPTGNGIAVMTSWSDGVACRSGDGGLTWTRHPIVQTDLLSHGMMFQVPSFANGVFLAWGHDFATGQGYRYSSTDGITWEQQALNGPAWIAANGVSLEGTLIATNGGMYEDQTISRSTDNGLTWIDIPTAEFVQSHGLTRFEAGILPCPSD